MRPALRPSRSLARLLAMAALPIALACHHDASITDITPPGGGAGTDSLLPTIDTVAVRTPFEAGDTVYVTAQDDYGLKRAVVLLLDSTKTTVLWRSDTLPLEGTDQRLAVPIGPLSSTFPYGVRVVLTAWVEDLAGKARYHGTPDTAALTLAKAQGTSLTIHATRTLRLPSGGAVGAYVYNPARREIYFTDTPHNTVRGLSIVNARLYDWTIPVGSEPTQIAFHPYAWGASSIGTLAVFNTGGTDVSIVDLTTAAGGQERHPRIVMPLIKVAIDGDTLRLGNDIQSILLQCATPASTLLGEACDTPVLYAGTKQWNVGGKSVLRTVALTDPDPAARFDLLTPPYRAHLTQDKAVQVSASLTSRDTGADSLLFTRNGVSLCGTLAFAAPLLAQTAQPDGPIFLAENGQSGCGSGGRVLRFDRGTDGYEVSAGAVLNTDWDPLLRAIQTVDVNADGSLVLLQSNDKVFVTDSTLRRLGTITAPSTVAAAFLAGQSGGPGGLEDGAILAVATTTGDGGTVTVYDTQHFQALATFTTATRLRAPLRFVPTDAQGGVALVALAADRTSFIVLPTSLNEIARRAAR